MKKMTIRMITTTLHMIIVVRLNPIGVVTAIANNKTQTFNTEIIRVCSNSVLSLIEVSTIGTIATKRKGKEFGFPIGENTGLFKKANVEPFSARPLKILLKTPKDLRMMNPAIRTTEKINTLSKYNTCFFVDIVFTMR
jgi:hypothetical protein